MLAAPFTLLAQTANPAPPPATSAPAPSEDPNQTALARPPYRLPRYEENWSFLRDKTGQGDFWATVKYIPFDERGDWYLSLGGEVRITYERFNNPDFGNSPDDRDGYALQRYLLHADLWAGDRLRFFAQLKSGQEDGRNGGPRPTDVDRFDLHQLFLDAYVLRGEAGTLGLRVGRQEMSFGSGRLVALREGPNVPLSYDGVRATFSDETWRVDGFAVKTVETTHGIFDDDTDFDRTFWGLYVTRPFNLIPQASIDVYYLGLDRKEARFVQGVNRETRHTVGTRIFGEFGAWSYDDEVIGQFGKFGSGDIRAWSLNSDTDYTFRSVPFHPKIGLEIDSASGDRNPKDKDLQTFNGLFQSGTYSGKAGILGPANATKVEPDISLKISEKVSVSAGWAFFWRTSTHDGIYTIAGNVGCTGRYTTARYVGSRPVVEAVWQVDRHLSLHANYIYVFTTELGTDNPPGRKDLSYVGLWATYRF